MSYKIQPSSQHSLQNSNNNETISILTPPEKKIYSTIFTKRNSWLPKGISNFVIEQGLGSSAEIKAINTEKRNQLKKMGGVEVKFGFQQSAIIEGMYLKAPKPVFPQKTILLCTGSHESYENYAVPMVREFLSMGYHVLTFNYEGFGKSGGTASEDGVYRSTEAAFQYLKQEKNCDDHSIVAWGYSLGSGAVSELSKSHPISIVIDRGFSSMSEVAYQQAPNLQKTAAKVIFSAYADFNNIDKIKKSTAKIFIADGKYDTTMPHASHGAKLKKAVELNPQAVYLQVNSSHHHNNEVWFQTGSDRTAIQDFLRKC